MVKQPLGQTPEPLAHAIRTKNSDFTYSTGRNVTICKNIFTYLFVFLLDKKDLKELNLFHLIY